MKLIKMDIKKPVLAAIFVGFAFSPTAALAFGAGLETSPNASAARVDVDAISDTYERNEQRQTSSTVCPAASESNDTACEDSDGLTEEPVEAEGQTAE